MYQRPTFPMNNGPFGGGSPMMRPGPQMFGGPGRQMGPGLPPFGGNQSMFRPGPGMTGGRNPLMGPQSNLSGMMGRQQMGGGGLLSRLFRSRNQMGGPSSLMGMQGAPRTGGGLLQSPTTPNGINTLLNNTQQVLKTAQTLGPMIQQYGPIVRNLPALWKLYRGIKNSDSEETQKSGPDESTSLDESQDTGQSDAKKSQTTSSKNTNVKNNKKGQRPAQASKGASVPKLYV